MCRDLVRTENPDEPYCPVDGYGINLNFLDTPARGTVMTRDRNGRKHGIEKLETFEPMGYWVSHESLKRDGGISEV